MTKSNKILVFDMNNIISRTFFSLNYKKEKLTQEDLQNTVKTIFANLTNLTHKFNIPKSETYCVFDSKEPSWRKLLTEDYKGKRESNEYLSKVIEYFVTHSQKTFGFNQIQISGVEADDIIAYMSIYDKSKEPIIIITNDKDLFQLRLEHNVQIFDTKANDFIKDNPVEILVQKIILGDKGDNVKSILENIETSIQYGDKKIEKLFENEFNLGETVSSMCNKALEDIISRYTKKKIEPEIIESNKIKLIENIHKNENLVSFYKLPEEVLSKIGRVYNEIEFQKLSDHILSENTVSINKTREI